MDFVTTFLFSSDSRLLISLPRFSEHQLAQTWVLSAPAACDALKGVSLAEHARQFVHQCFTFLSAVVMKIRVSTILWKSHPCFGDAACWVLQGHHNYAPPSGKPSWQQRIILVSGCQRDETSAELPGPDGQNNGALTASILTIIQQRGGQLSYRCAAAGHYCLIQSSLECYHAQRGAIMLPYPKNI